VRRAVKRDWSEAYTPLHRLPAFFPRDDMRKRIFVVGRCLSVRLCMQKAEDIVKLLSRPGSPIILYLTPSAGPNSKGNLFSGSAKYTGMGRICDFLLKLLFVNGTR